MSRGQIPLIIGDLDVYPQRPCQIGVPTLNSEEPAIVSGFACGGSGGICLYLLLDGNTEENRSAGRIRTVVAWYHWNGSRQQVHSIFLVCSGCLWVGDVWCRSLRSGLRGGFE